MDAWGWAITATYIVFVLVASVTLSLRKKPQTAIAWILTIVFIPLIGITAFLLIGVGRLPRHRREKQRAVNEAMLSRTEITNYRIDPSGLGWLDTAVVMNERLGSLPMVSGNVTRLIEGYEESLNRMIADIDAATEHVHVQFYILVKDSMTTPFFDALERAVKRGVTVRVLSDHIAGFMYPHRKETQQALAEMGATWHPMLPLKPWRGLWQRPDLRNHRKAVIIDGAVGYTGSQNLIHENYLKPKNIKKGLHWVELMVRMEGPAVGELDAVFAADWFSETNEMLPLHTAPIANTTATQPDNDLTVTDVPVQVVPSGPSFENDNNLKLFVMLIHNARSRVSITSPYFVPDESTYLALLAAAARGLDVELFVSEVVDQVFVHFAQRSYYEELLDAGVAIYRYREPAVLHSKHFTIDDDISVVGSSNMDMRSFSLNMEISLLIHNREFAERLRLVEDTYRARSTRIDPTEWKHRPLTTKILEGLTRLTAALQ